MLVDDGRDMQILVRINTAHDTTTASRRSAQARATLTAQANFALVKFDQSRKRSLWQLVSYFRDTRSCADFVFITTRCTTDAQSAHDLAVCLESDRTWERNYVMDRRELRRELVLLHKFEESA